MAGGIGVEGGVASVDATAPANAPEDVLTDLVVEPMTPSKGLADMLFFSFLCHEYLSVKTGLTLFSNTHFFLGIQQKNPVAFAGSLRWIENNEKIGVKNDVLYRKK